MKKLCVLAVGILLSISSFAQTTASSNSTQSAATCSTAFFTAMLNEDSNLFGQVVTSDFTLVSTEGRQVDRDLLSQALGGGQLVLDASTVSNTNTRTYNDNAAVVTGNWNLKGSLQGNPITTNSLFTLVCVKQNNAWKVASIQMTDMR